MPSMRTLAGLCAGETETLAVRFMSASGFADGRDHTSQYENPAHPVVLGRLLDDDEQARYLSAIAPAPARNDALRDRLDDAP